MTVYNLRIEEYHTYFVGCAEWGFSIWAHNAFYVNPAVNEAFAMGPHIEQLIADAETVKDSINAASAVGDDFLMGILQDSLEVVENDLADQKWILEFFEQIGNAL